VNISNGTAPNLTTTIPTLCSGNNITFTDLSKEVGVTSGLLWYSASKGGVAAKMTDKINFPPMSQTYYVAYKPNQAGVCESKERVKVILNLILTPTNVLMKDHFYEPCKDAKETVANLPTAPYASNSIAWFSDLNALNPQKPTDPLYSTHYYAASYSIDPISGKKCYSSSKDLVDVHLYDVAFIVYPENSICDKSTGALTIEEKNLQGYSPFTITVKDPYGGIVGNSLKTTNLKSGEYTIEVTDAKQCKHSVTEMVGCTVLNLPQIITPDGDGKNDTWVIKYYEKYSNVQVSIYNRWGSKVYTSEIPYMDNWDGRPSTDVLSLGEGYLPTGTYFYVIDKGNGEAVESGYIELVK
jgi:gliding motility-associated-like protein